MSKPYWHHRHAPRIGGPRQKPATPEKFAQAKARQDLVTRCIQENPALNSLPFSQWPAALIAELRKLGAK